MGKNESHQPSIGLKCPAQMEWWENFTQELARVEENHIGQDSYKSLVVLRYIENNINRVAGVLLKIVGFLFYRKQLSVVFSEMGHVPFSSLENNSILFEALIQAEDRRFLCHHGVDARAVVRATITRVCRNRIQGGSTITQQLVRVITGNYEMSLRRKWQEVCIAAAVDAKFSKSFQLSLYLRVAYFGWNINSLEKLIETLRIRLPLDEFGAAEVVARLKYPERRWPSAEYLCRQRARVRHIALMIVAR